MWPKKPETTDPTNANPDTAPPEKSAAELIAESLKPLTDSFTTLQKNLDDRLAALEQNTRKPEPTREPVTATSVLENEDVAFAQRLTPIMARQLELESRIVYSDIQREYARAGFGELWEQHEKEIGTILDQSALVTAEGKPLRGDPQYIRNVADMVFGKAARSAGMRFDSKSKSFFIESATGRSDANPSAVPDGLNDKQRHIMNRMGITPEEAKKTMAKLQFVS
jgi:hypothetical protein